MPGLNEAAVASLLLPLLLWQQPQQQQQQQQQQQCEHREKRAERGKRGQQCNEKEDWEERENSASSKEEEEKRERAVVVRRKGMDGFAMYGCCVVDLCSHLLKSSSVNSGKAGPLCENMCSSAFFTLKCSKMKKKCCHDCC